MYTTETMNETTFSLGENTKELNQKMQGG